MNAQEPSRRGRAPNPRVRHEPVWRDLPRRADNSARDLLSLAASLWVAVIVLAGPAVAVIVLWPLLALVATGYVSRRPVRAAALRCAGSPLAPARGCELGAACGTRSPPRRVGRQCFRRTISGCERGGPTESAWLTASGFWPPLGRGHSARNMAGGSGPVARGRA